MKLLNLCSCGQPLELTEMVHGNRHAGFRCHCPRCRRRADAGEGDGFIVAVTGYGDTPLAAVDDYRARVNTF